MNTTTIALRHPSAGGVGATFPGEAGLVGGRHRPSGRTRRDRHDLASASPTETRKGVHQKRLGVRFVGVSVLLVCVTLAMLLTFAAFHTRLAAGQYRLVELESAVETERERLIDLQVQLKSAEAPDKLETLARGALGLVGAEDPTSLSISSEHITNASRVSASRRGVGTDWLLLKELLGTSAVTQNGR